MSSQWEGYRPVWERQRIEKRKADPITDEEEERMWVAKVLGSESSRSLNFTVWYLLSQQFGTRGCQEHYQFCVQDLKFVNDPLRKPSYAEWVEGLTKTRKGGLSKYERRLPQSVFAVPDSDRCPLQFLSLLLSKRPPDLQSCDPLYLRPLNEKFGLAVNQLVKTTLTHKCIKWLH